MAAGTQDPVNYIEQLLPTISIPDLKKLLEKVKQCIIWKEQEELKVEGAACGVCTFKVTGAKCGRCKTIYWDRVLQATKKKRSLSQAPGDQTRAALLQPQNRDRPRSVGAEQRAQGEYLEDRQRQAQIKFAVSRSQHSFTCDRCQSEIRQPGLCDLCVRNPLCTICKSRFNAAQGCCPKCEVMCQRCRTIRGRNFPRCLKCEQKCSKCRAPFDSQIGYCTRCEILCKLCGRPIEGTSTFCAHCNKQLKETMCMMCHVVPAKGPSGLCQACYARPVTAPVNSSPRASKSAYQPPASLPRFRPALPQGRHRK